MRDISDWMNDILLHRTEVIVIRFHDTDVHGMGHFALLFQQYFPGQNGNVRLNDDGGWPTLRDAVRKNKRVFVFMSDRLCNADCRKQYPYARWVGLEVDNSGLPRALSLYLSHNPGNYTGFSNISAYW